MREAYPIASEGNNVDDLLERGYTEVPDKPEPANNDEIVEWDYTNKTWNIRPAQPSDFVHDWYLVRTERDRLLKESDIEVLKTLELGQTVSQAMQDYRTQLRDIPQTYSNPKDVVWPAKPE